MKPVRLNDNCIRCLINKYCNNFPEGSDRISRLSYTQSVLKEIASASEETSAPELVEKIKILREKHLGVKEDYSEEKVFFNNLALSVEGIVSDRIKADEDSLKSAVKYAMLGNYIDFGAMAKIDEKDFLNQLNKSDEIYISDEEYNQFKLDLSKSERLVYLTDNCGEIVFDKLLIRIIKNMYPHIEMNVIVRGFPAINDVTMEDAIQTGLTEIVPVTGNGTAIAGTALGKISPEALELINNADMIISKGQGNFETLRQCGLNIYYLFLCKCEMFAKRFNSSMFTGVFINEKRNPVKE